jgi:DNA-binding beta-propeller fold protein YncE
LPLAVHTITTIPVGDHPAYSVYDPASKFVYVINSNQDFNNKNGAVSIINGTTNYVVATVKVGILSDSNRG